MSNRIDTKLTVWLKGADLQASTAALALSQKMGYGDRLIGLRRLDFFHLEIHTPVSPEATVERLKKILDSQSTFYNRNKHACTLLCQWDDARHMDGVSIDEVRRSWLSNRLKNKGVSDLDGKESDREVTFIGSRGYVVEVLVEDEDSAARDRIAAKLNAAFSRTPQESGVTVTTKCVGTLWWLALEAGDEEAARDMAKEITVSTRRDKGLLLNPHYQHAEFVSVEPFGSRQT